MAWNGSGTFQRVRNWVNDAAAGVKIRADYHDTEDNNFASGISNCIAKDGQSTILAAIPFNNQRITGLGDPINPQDALNKQWAQANLVSGAYVADTPPAAAQAGNLWWDSDQGGLYLKYSDGTSTQWVQVNVGTTTADAPQDGNEYVRVNGTWRLKEQRLALSGQASVDVPVPAWATAVDITAVQYLPLNNSMIMRISGDGTTFTTTGYYVNGPTNAVSSASFNTQATAPVGSLTLSTTQASVVGVPSLGKYTLNLQRTAAADYFMMGGQQKYHASANSYITVWYTFLAGEGASFLRINALRIYINTGTFGTDAQCILRWS